MTVVDAVTTSAVIRLLRSQSGNPPDPFAGDFGTID